MREQARRRKGIRDEMLSGEKSETTASLIKEALDRVAAPTRLEEELSRARRHIAELEQKLRQRKR